MEIFHKTTHFAFWCVDMTVRICCGIWDRLQAPFETVAVAFSYWF